MKQVTKRILAVLLTVAMVLALIPMSLVSAATPTELSIPVINVQQSSESQTATALLLSSENLLVGAYEAKTTPRADAGKGYIKIDRNACFFSTNYPTVSSAIAQSYVAATGTNLSYDSESGKYVLFSYGVIIEPNTPVGTYYIDLSLEVLVSPEGIDHPYTPSTLAIQVNVVDAPCSHSTTRTSAKAATCTDAGNSEYYTCTRCGLYFSDAAATTEIAENSWIIPALGHDMVTDPAVAPTCTTAGKTEGSHCTRCDYAVAQQEIAALGHDLTILPAVEPACTTPGKTEGCECSRCDYAVAQQEIPALGHDWNDGLVTVEPTTTTEGEMTYTCERCGETRTEAIPMLSNTIPVDTDNDEKADTEVEAEPGEGLTYVDGDGNVYIPVDSNVEDGNIDGETDFYVEVTEDEDGDYPYTDSFGNDYIPVDFDGDGEADTFITIDDEDNDGKPEDEAGNEYEGVDADGDGDPDYWVPETTHEHTYTPEIIQFKGYVYGTFYSCNDCEDCYYEAAPECTSGSECPSSAYDDLVLTDWYHRYTDFAITTGMMRGTGTNTFEPHTTTSRAMVVMVLWNLENQPESSAEMPFSDVNPSDWYYSAILWANENEIARGKGDGIFDPNGNVTRQELAAFIYRYAEWKGCDVSARADLSVFPDAGDTSDWAVENIQWAVAIGFIYGRGDNGTLTLSPQDDGTRCEFATMMMRFASNILMKPTWDRINLALTSAGKEPVGQIK